MSKLPSLIKGSHLTTSITLFPEAIPLDIVWNIIVILITAFNTWVTYVIAAITLPGVTEPAATWIEPILMTATTDILRIIFIIGVI